MGSVFKNSSSVSVSLTSLPADLVETIAEDSISEHLENVCALVKLRRFFDEVHVDIQ